MTGNQQVTGMRVWLVSCLPSRRHRQAHGADEAGDQEPTANGAAGAGFRAERPACTIIIIVAAAMRHRKTLLVASALLVGAGIWLGLAWTRPVSPYAALNCVAPGQTNSHGEVFGVGTFWMTNLSNRTIHMNASSLEVKDGD